MGEEVRIVGEEVRIVASIPAAAAVAALALNKAAPARSKV